MYLEDVIELFIEAMPELIRKQVQLLYLKVPTRGHHSSVHMCIHM